MAIDKHIHTTNIAVKEQVFANDHRSIACIDTLSTSPPRNRCDGLEKLRFCVEWRRGGRLRLLNRLGTNVFGLRRILALLVLRANIFLGSPMKNWHQAVAI